MSILMNQDSMRDAYNRVRSDDNEETWMLMKYEDKQVALTGTGVMYDEFLIKLADDERAYGYVRVETGDEMSKRAKFAFVTWIGPDVLPLKKAKVSTDKGFVKNVLPDFAVEILADDKDELKYETIKQKVIKAGGANYGTGK